MCQGLGLLSSPFAPTNFRTAGASRELTGGVNSRPNGKGGGRDWPLPPGSPEGGRVLSECQVWDCLRGLGGVGRVVPEIKLRGSQTKARILLLGLER